MYQPKESKYICAIYTWNSRDFSSRPRIPVLEWESEYGEGIKQFCLQVVDKHSAADPLKRCVATASSAPQAIGRK